MTPTIPEGDSDWIAVRSGSQDRWSNGSGKGAAGGRGAPQLAAPSRQECRAQAGCHHLHRGDLSAPRHPSARVPQRRAAPPRGLDRQPRRRAHTRRLESRSTILTSSQLALSEPHPHRRSSQDGYRTPFPTGEYMVYIYQHYRLSSHSENGHFWDSPYLTATTGRRTFSGCECKIFSTGMAGFLGSLAESAVCGLVVWSAALLRRAI